MGDLSHKEVQNFLLELGNRLGFLYKKEFSLENLYPRYSPKIDMVWFLCLGKEGSEAISKIYDPWPYAEGSNLLYPIRPLRSREAMPRQRLY